MLNILPLRVHLLIYFSHNWLLIYHKYNTNFPVNKSYCYIKNTLYLKEMRQWRNGRIGGRDICKTVAHILWNMVYFESLILCVFQNNSYASPRFGCSLSFNLYTWCYFFVIWWSGWKWLPENWQLRIFTNTLSLSCEWDPYSHLLVLCTACYSSDQHELLVRKCLN